MVKFYAADVTGKKATTNSTIMRTNDNKVKILFEYQDFEGNYALESAWAEAIETGYRLDNILFYADEFAYNDIVRVEDREGELFVVGLINESGHSTVRILFKDAEAVESTRRELASMNCSSEISNIVELVSVDIPPSTSYEKVKKYLDDGVNKNLWGYEEACIAHSNG